MDNSSKSQEKTNKAVKSKINSVDKSLKPSNRVFSAASLTDKLSKTKTHNLESKTKNIDLVAKGAKVWVTYFEDNPKFGMAFLLNSGAVGFRFNDKSVIVSNSKATEFKYLTYDSNLKSLTNKPSIWGQK